MRDEFSMLAGTSTRNVSKASLLKYQLILQPCPSQESSRNRYGDSSHEQGALQARHHSGHVKRPQSHDDKPGCHVHQAMQSAPKDDAGGYVEMHSARRRF